MQVSRRKIFSALFILSLFVVVAVIISSNRPQPMTRPETQSVGLEVEAMSLKAGPYQFWLDSFGTVSPRTQSLLVAQVSGEIVEVSPVFRDGGYFERGEILISIDDRDYKAAVQSAQATLLQAQSSLEQEKAQAQQAATDWERLGDGLPAPDLVLRKPQLAAAEAAVLSAQANLNKAELDLQRTRVRAPYDGRVLSTSVDLGQYVNSNGTLGEIFATDVVEIRLPLKDSDLPFIELPTDFRDTATAEEDLPKVEIISHLGKPQVWQGVIVRTEAALDSDSHQLYVVAQIRDPFAAHNNDKDSLKIGQYVTARIQGVRRVDALVIPIGSLYQGSYVYAIEGGVLKRKDVSIAFQTPSQAVIENGLKSGEDIVTSPLGQVASGTAVRRIETSVASSSTAAAAEESVQ